MLASFPQAVGSKLERLKELAMVATVYYINNIATVLAILSITVGCCQTRFNPTYRIDTMLAILCITVVVRPNLLMPLTELALVSHANDTNFRFLHHVDRPGAIIRSLRDVGSPCMRCHR